MVAPGIETTRRNYKKAVEPSSLALSVTRGYQPTTLPLGCGSFTGFAHFPSPELSNLPFRHFPWAFFPESVSPALPIVSVVEVLNVPTNGN